MKRKCLLIAGSRWSDFNPLKWVQSTEQRSILLLIFFLLIFVPFIDWSSICCDSSQIFGFPILNGIEYLDFESKVEFPQKKSIYLKCHSEKQITILISIPQKKYIIFNENDFVLL